MRNSIKIHLNRKQWHWHKSAMSFNFRGFWIRKRGKVEKYFIRMLLHNLTATQSIFHRWLWQTNIPTWKDATFLKTDIWRRSSHWIIHPLHLCSQSRRIPRKFRSLKLLRHSHNLKRWLMDNFFASNLENFQVSPCKKMLFLGMPKGKFLKVQETTTIN